MSGRALIFVAAIATASACGVDGTPNTAPPTFAGDPDQSIVSDSGALRIAVRFAPEPLVVGSDAAELAFTDENGQPVTGLGLTVVPWMPAHGHGTSVNPMVTEATPGTFVASPLYLFMPGSWELRMTTTGAVADTATAAFELQ